VSWIREIQYRYLSRNTKNKWFKTPITHVLLYGSECWTLNKDNEERLKTFERKILRKIYGPMNEGGKWRIRCNNELYKLRNESNVTGVMKAGRVRWLGHLIPTDDYHPCNEVTCDQLCGARRKARRSTRWLDDVERDLERANVSNWKMKARGRSVWRNIIGAVLA
jgi:hypothetical protein